MNYRQDIDGLRAIAVVAVVLFHLDVSGFDGGYVGVDVFFVISGYLITSLIRQKLEAGSFRLLDFYGRRIRRLYPPLLMTIAAAFLAATLLLSPVDMIGFSRSAVAALVSVSNISFYLEAGYWDAASELKPLLHTWSLGVEEQFYLFWPAILLMLFRLRNWISFTTALAVFASLGFALCVWVTSLDQAAAFYLLPFRAFQFALGALLIPLTAALVSRERSRLLNSSLLTGGLALIVASIINLGEGTRFPGWVVLLPSLGAALCLLSGAVRGSLPVSLASVLANPVSLWFGRVSYSMYLVHWPIIVLYRYENGLVLTLSDQLLLGLLTLAGTCALHFGVERRLYTRVGYGGGKHAAISKRLVFSGVLAGLVTLAALGSHAWLSGGWSWRYPGMHLSPEQIREGQKARLAPADRACRVDYPSDHLLCDATRPRRVLVIGNSHEVDGYNIASEMFRERDDLELILFGNMNACGSVSRSGVRLLSRDDDCQARLDALFAPDFVNRLHGVIYSANRPFARNKMPALSVLTALKARKPAVKILTFGGYINTERRCAFYINRTGDSSACAWTENVAYFADDPSREPLYDDFKNLTDDFIDKVELLCQDRALESCITMTRDRIPVFYDESHLSLEFAQMVGQMLRDKAPF